MNVLETPLPGVIVIRHRVFGDERGRFFELFNTSRMLEGGIDARFVQDNVSVSAKGVLRGLHYQWPTPQGKLVTVLSGAVFDVAVDLRPDSPNFRRWYGRTLRADAPESMWVPRGFAHGFAVLEDNTVFHYKVDNPYIPEADRAVRFDDSEIGVEWPFTPETLSNKDQNAPLLKELTPEMLPTG